MSTCKLKIDLNVNKALSGLAEWCGTDTKAFYSYLTEVVRDDVIRPDGTYIFTDDFIESWKEDEPLDVVKTNPHFLRKNVIEFYEKHHNSTKLSEQSSKDKDMVATYGYVSESGRAKAFSDFAAYVRRSFYTFDTVRGTANKNHITTAKEQISLILVDRLSELLGYKQSSAEALDLEDSVLDSKWFDFASFAKSHNVTLDNQFKNVLGLYNEFTQDEDEFIEKLKTRQDIGLLPIFRKEDDPNDSFENLDTTDDATVEPDNSALDVEDVDDQITKLNNKDGESSDAMKVLDTDIKALLSTLWKKKKTKVMEGQLVADTNTETGIPDTIDATAAYYCLVNYCDFDTEDIMLESIIDVSNKFPEFSCLKDLHDILKGNNALRSKFKVQLSRGKVGKIGIETGNGSYSVFMNPGMYLTRNLSNLLCDRFKFMSHGATNLANIDADLRLAKDKIDELEETERLATSQEERITDIVDYLYSAFKGIYGEFDRQSIESFILYKKREYNEFGIKGEWAVKQFKENASQLLAHARDILRNLDKADDAWNKHDIKIADAKAKNTNINKEIRKLRCNVPGMPEGMPKKLSEEKLAKIAELKKQLVDVESLKNENPINSNLYAPTLELARTISDYTYQHVPLNFRNAEKKQVSAIINNSMMTQFLELIHSKQNTYHKDENKNVVIDETSPIYKLREWMRTGQYDYSNILLEHRDENGEIINKGLFYKKDDDYFVTPYWQDVLDIFLMDGVMNVSSGEGKMYKDMFQPDFFATQWTLFNSVDPVPSPYGYHDDNKTLYTMRIPSDKPKIFCIEAPKYDTKDLLKQTNVDDLDDSRESFLSSILSDERIVTDTKDVIKANNPIYITADKFWKFALESNHYMEGLIDIPVNGKKNKLINTEERKRYAFKVFVPNSTKTENTNTYVVEGIYKDGVIHDAQFIGKINNFTKDVIGEYDNIFWDDVDKHNLRQYSINRDNVVFKQIRQSLVGDLQMMCKAAKALFAEETLGDARIAKTLNGEVQYNTDNCKNNDDINNLLENYHYTKVDKKRTITAEVNGKTICTGRVFKLDDFNIYSHRDKTYHRFGDELMDKCFNVITFDKKTQALTWDAEGNIKLSRAQKEAIDDTVEKYIETLIYSEQAKYNKDYAFTLRSKPTINEVASFAVNYNIAYRNFDDLFEGSSKFYKDTQTVLKRAGETQGSGLIHHVDDNLENNELNDTVFTKKTLNDEQLPVEEVYAVKPQTSFTAVTINNSIITDHKTIDAIESYITDEAQMGEFVVSKERARELMEGFEDTTANDAQTYITFDEWIRRVTARGQLPKYKTLIDRILDETKPISLEDVTKFIQVQKNFYYDQEIDKRYNIRVPRQIKNAEFVLVPRFIKGTELELVEKFMQKCGINQLNTKETSKARNGRTFTIWDNDGTMNKDFYDDMVNTNPNVAYKSDILKELTNPINTYIEKFYYKNLYLQLDMPQHLGEMSKLGIQFQKKIKDNIDESSPTELQESAKLADALYCANIVEDANSVINDITVKDENGKPNVSKKKLYDSVKQECVRTGLTENMAECLTVDESTYDSNTIMPSYLGMDSVKLQNALQSVFNNRIVRQKFPAFHVEQITSIGFAELGGKGEGKKIKDSRLQYHPQLYKKGNDIITQREYDKLDDKDKKQWTKDKIAPYIEVLLPPTAFGLSRNSEKYANLKATEDKTLKQVQDEAMLADLKALKLDEVIGYRVPTEGEQSIAIMKCVGFLDETQGSTIAVPDLWVAQTGSDFDADSIYGLTYPTDTNNDGSPKAHKYYDKIEDLWKKYVRRKMSKESKDAYYKASEKEKKEFNYANIAYLEFLDSLDDFKAKYEGENGVIKANSRKARYSKMLDCWKTILAHNASYEQVLSRSNTTDVEASLKKLEKYIDNSRNYRTPYVVSDQIEFQTDAMGGASLKEISVARDTFTSKCNKTKVEYGLDDSLFKVKYSKENYSENELRARFGKVDVASDGYIVNHKQFGWSNDNRNVDGKYTTIYTSETTAYALDAVKKGALPNVNVNTFGVFKTIVDMGSNYDIALAFIMQPAISKFNNIYNQSNSVFGFSSKPRIRDVFAAIADEMGYDTNNLSKDDIIELVGLTPGQDIVLSYDELTNRLESNSKGINGRKELLFDMRMLMVYDKIAAFSEHVTNLQNCLTPDKQGAKATFYQTKKLLNKIVNNADSNALVDKDGKPLLQVVYPFTKSVEGQIVEDEIDLLNNIFASGDDDLIQSPMPYLPLFIKYTTALSYHCNREIFELENGAISEFIYDLQSVFSSGKNVTEQIHNDFRNYIINVFRNETTFIKAPLKYEIGKGFIHPDITRDSEGNLVNYDEVNKIRYGEVSRIFGLSSDANAFKSFRPADVNNPTQKEVDEYCKLSPAEKLMFVKANFTDIEAFVYFTPRTDVKYVNGVYRPDSHAIFYEESITNIDIVRNQIAKAFSNTNPLIACCAADLLKYAVVAEEFRIGMHNVTKAIPNSIMRRDGMYGTDMAEEVRNQVARYSEYMPDSLANELYRRYICSSKNGIYTGYVGKRNDVWELNKDSKGIIHLSPNMDKDMLYKFKISNKKGDKYNTFVKLVFDDRTWEQKRDPRSVYNPAIYSEDLYKILPRIIGDTLHIFLYPLNELERGETSKVSVNPKFRKHNNPEWYEELIDEYVETANDVFDEEEFARLESTKDDSAIELDVNKNSNIITDFNTNPVYSDLRQTISDWYTNRISNNEPILYVANRPITKYMQDHKMIVGQEVVLDNGEVIQVAITKPRYIKSINKLLNVSNPDSNRKYQRYKKLVDIVKNITKVGNIEEVTKAHFENLDLYQITPFTPTTEVNVEEAKTNVDEEIGAKASTEYDVASEGISSTRRRAAASKDEFASKYVHDWEERRLSSNIEELKKNPVAVEDTLRDLNTYLHKVEEDLMYKLSHFDKDDDGNYLAVNTKECINKIKSDPRKRRDFLALIQEPMTIVKQFGIIEDLNVESRNPITDKILDGIKTTIRNIRNNEYSNQAYELYATEYLDEISTDPLIREGLISVKDGYYRTNWANANFSDIQESSNPIVQIVMKNFKSQLWAAQMQSKRKADEFASHMENLRLKAKKEGKSLNLNNIIDEYGRFIPKYNEKFEKDRNELKKSVLDAKSKFGENSVEHLKAKLKFDEWAVEHIELPVEKSYYLKRNEILNKILYPKNSKTGNPDIDASLEDSGMNEYKQLIPELYSEYKKTVKAIIDLNNKYAYDLDNEDYIKELNELQNKLYDIKGFYEEDFGSETYMAKRSLRKKLKELRKLENEYFVYKPKPGFEEKLEENIKIVQSFELSDIPSNLYIDNPKYKAAKRWLVANVEEDIEKDEEWKEIQKDLDKADKDLGKGTSFNHRNVVLTNRQYFNEFGEFDPALVSDEDAKQVKDEDKKDFDAKLGVNTDDRAPLDKNLIRNAYRDANGVLNEDVYTPEFYTAINGGKLKYGNVKTQWYSTIAEINFILGFLYNNETKEIDFEKLPTNDASVRAIYGDDYVNSIIGSQGVSTNKADVAILERLKLLYDKLDSIKANNKGKKSVARFIEKNVDIKVNENKYNRDVDYANRISGLRGKALLDIIRRPTYNEEEEGTVPSNYLYSVMIPKDSKFIDKSKTAAIKIINRYTEKVLSPSYNAIKTKKFNEGEEAYNKWYNSNHIYNPYTHTYEPISIWYKKKYKGVKTNYYPKFNETYKEIRQGFYSYREAQDIDENALNPEDKAVFKDSTPKEISETYLPKLNKVNKNYKPDMPYTQNYIVGSGYDNPSKANDIEREAADYIMQSLLEVAKTDIARNYIKKGWLPAARKGVKSNSKEWAKEALRAFGFMPNRYEAEDWTKDVSLANDEIPQMPMLKKLEGKGSRKLPKYPKQKPNESSEDYAKRLLEYEKEKSEIEKNNLEIHKSLLNTDFEKVIQEFILQSGRYNAIQDGKYELFYALEMLKKNGVYNVNWNKYGRKYLKQKFSGRTEDSKAYTVSPDKNLIEQFENQIRREIYDQFKQPNNPKLMQTMQLLQTLTSAQNMMMNVKGGISNWTLGSTQIRGEAWTKAFFDNKTLNAAIKEYGAGITDYILHWGDLKSSTKQGALIKFMDIVDFDEQKGVIDATKDSDKALQKVKDGGFAPQTCTEHSMQNTVLIAMCKAYRVFKNPRAEELGQPKYILKNLSDHIADVRKEALRKVISEDKWKAFEKFEKTLSSDKEAFMDYALFKKDLITEFSRTYLTIEERKAINDERKKLEDKAKEEFENDAEHPTLYDQVTIKNGELAIAEGSKLSEIDNGVDSLGLSSAFRLLAEFKGKVISVNKYIHGSYDKSGRAQIEKGAIGGLIMQFHKHLPIGIRKRWGIEGYYNESRDAVTKGMYRSLADFLLIPFRKHKAELDLSDENVEAVEVAQSLMQRIVDFCTNISLNWNELPDYEKANIKRLKADMYGVLMALAFMILIKCVADDDDEDDTLYNLAIYECDRLASEAGMYTAFTLPSEAKKLWQSSIAAESGITDILSSANQVAHMLMSGIFGTEYESTYTTGKWAGESKIKVYLERRIPIWRGIKSSFIDINKTNKYYKIGENIFGFVDADAIAKAIKQNTK